MLKLKLMVVQCGHGVTILMKTALSILLFLMLATRPVISGERPLSFEQVLEIGLKNNYSIRIARNEAQAAQNSSGLGTAAFLPQVNASGNGSLSNTSEQSTSPFSLGNTDVSTISGQIALSWTIFDGFRMFADRARYHELARLGQEKARATIEETVVAIGQAYFNLVQQELLLEVAVETRDVSRIRLEKMQIRRDLGGASSTDYLNAQVAFNRAKVAIHGWCIPDQPLAALLRVYFCDIQQGWQFIFRNGLIHSSTSAGVN